MSKRKLVLLTAMVAILVLGITIPAVAQLNTGNVQNIQRVLQYKSAADDPSLTGTNTGSTPGDTGLTGTNTGPTGANTGSAAGNATDVETCTGETIELNSDEKQMLDLHNQTRANNGLPPLCVHPDLTEAARFHSQEMLDKGYFSHDSRNGESVRARLERFGYTFAGHPHWKYGENVSWGSGHLGAADRRFDDWMDSAEHKANILDKNFRDVGIGTRTGTFEGQDGTKMYTVDFGTRR
jgi:uncharacterized protein YkwD